MVDAAGSLRTRNHCSKYQLRCCNSCTLDDVLHVSTALARMFQMMMRVMVMKMHINIIRPCTGTHVSDAFVPTAVLEHGTIVTVPDIS